MQMVSLASAAARDAQILPVVDSSDPVTAGSAQLCHYDRGLAFCHATGVREARFTHRRTPGTGMSVMKRLSCLLGIAISACASGAATGQTANFTVAGDVDRPDTWALDQNQTVSLIDLLEHAGAGRQGSAIILRGRPPEQFFSEYVSPQMSDRGSLLTSHDIVIYHDRDRVRTAPRSVVILADAVPRIVNLAPGENVLGSLLVAIGARHSPDTRIPAIRTQQGRPDSIRLLPSDPIVHGDVLFLTPAVQLDPVRISQLFHMHVPETSLEHTTVQPVFALSPVNESGVTCDSSGLLIPDLAVDTVSAPEDSVSDEYSATTIVITPVAAKTVIAEEPPFAVPGSPEPAAPGTFPAAQSAAASPLWNGVFVLGLLGAIGLIITGWLKARSEQTATGETASRVKTFSVRNSVDGISQPANAKRPGAPEAPPEEQTAESRQESGAKKQPWSPVNEKSLRTEVLSTADSSADELIGDQEWFSGDLTDGDAPLQQASSPESAERSSPTEVVTSGPDGIGDSLSAGSGTDELEDLIQNRLPIQLQQTELPLKVTLFGRPAGPQRLRVDADHTELAAPHFAAGSRSGNQTREADRTAATSKSVTGEIAALDRALTALHGQNNS